MEDTSSLDEMGALSRRKQPCKKAAPKAQTKYTDTGVKVKGTEMSWSSRRKRMRKNFYSEDKVIWKPVTLRLSNLLPLHDSTNDEKQIESWNQGLPFLVPVGCFVGR